MGSDIHAVFQKLDAGKWQDIPHDYEENRHYVLFAWLADVRNGHGFAAVPTHTAIVPISEPRGLPKDFEMDGDNHPSTRDCIAKWMGDHSHSWLTAAEILSTKPPTILRTGIVERAWFDKWDGKTGPEHWSGMITGPGIVISDPSEIHAKTSHVRIEWFEDTGNTLKYFTDEIRRLQDEHGEVRMVFGFDS